MKNMFVVLFCGAIALSMAGCGALDPALTIRSPVRGVMQTQQTELATTQQVAAFAAVVRPAAAEAPLSACPVPAFGALRRSPEK